MSTTFTVLGSGSWGSAIAIHLARKGFTVKQWIREKNIVELIENTKFNKVFMPYVEYPDNIYPTNDIIEAINFSDNIIIAIPVQYIISILDEVKNQIQNKIILNLSKGINIEPLELISDMFDKIFVNSNNKFLYLSGPSFAKEVALKKITSVVIAGEDSNLVKEFQQLFSNEYFRVYAQEDIIGVQLGGAIKNVIAIAAGISDGLNLGNNARSALITRGLSEMSRLGIVLGAKQGTFYGLSGIGDLVLTCTSDLSRNKTVGYQLSKGISLKNILNSSFHVPEGITTVKALYFIGQKYNVEMPICNAIYEILYHNLHPKEALFKLMKRSLKDETK